MHGNVSPKIDIFSFGVLMLEIVTKRRNCGSDDCETDTVNLLSDVSGSVYRSKPATVLSCLKRSPSVPYYNKLMGTGMDLLDQRDDITDD